MRLGATNMTFALGREKPRAATNVIYKIIVLDEVFVIDSSKTLTLFSNSNESHN
jgi:hypothetical protein